MMMLLPLLAMTMMLLPLLGTVQAFAPDLCGCIGASAFVDHPTYQDNAGLFCSAWDLSMPVCLEAKVKPTYCKHEWCYVSEHCDSAQPSIYHEGYYYSYKACGFPDTFTHKCSPMAGSLTQARMSLGSQWAPEGMCMTSTAADGHQTQGRALHGGTTYKDHDGDGEHDFDGLGENQMTADAALFEVYDLNEDRVINEADRELLFEASDSDENGCIDVCEYMHWHSSVKGCPVTKEWEMIYGLMFLAEAQPMMRALDDWGVCIAEAAFVGASENMFWVCHSTLEDWQDPDHTSNFPFCAKNRKRMP
mmetsp:Transcript_24892/g.73902  ORF Transcript_24892/g.73902 Transcript_24892/m.73902 type:complete len:305 (+) Transcript_24892:3-917(+)